ncbi:pectate lyase [Pectobacterium aroidearum]|uniref:pectate lyase n=1 Tax=Pectobacterium aroidearum TaxID=1201031 RepID=UPI002A834F78|nr:pectate lyase [Pectobacterium aroidearum]MDY4389162.1 pectate lyase [Pectobacterium aroidearum]
MADMTITLSIQPGAGLSSTGLNSPLSGSNSGASQRSAQQDSQLMEALGTLLSALLPNAQGNTPSSTDGSPLGQTGASNGGSSALGQNGSPADMLMKLLEALIPGKNGQEAGNPLSSGSSGAAGGNSGASPLTGSSGPGGAGSAQNPEDLSRSLLQDSAGSALNNAISPTADGGGQLSGNDLLKALLELIGNLMDSQKGEFGQPQGSGQSQGGGSPSVGAPQAASGGGGGSPAAPSAGGGGSPAAPSAPASPVGGGGAAPAPLTATPSGIGGGSATSPTTSTAGAGPVSFPTASGDATVVNETIKVGPGETFDGGGKTFTAGSKLGDGGQAEGQKPVFELAPGATLKNVVFGDNAADGVHVRGDAKIDNVHWTNVGEDALTVKSNTGKPANVEITNSSAQGAADKIFQLNADANLTIDNFKAKDFGTFVRTNGGQQGNWNLNLSNIDAENGKFSFVKSDSEGLNVKGSNINLTNVNNHYKVPDSANLQVN